MLRIIAAIVAHEGPAYLALLERLKRDYDAARRDNAQAYARHLLYELTHGEEVKPDHVCKGLVE